MCRTRAEPIPTGSPDSAWASTSARSPALVLAVSVTSQKLYDARATLLLTSREPINTLLNPTGATQDTADLERDINTSVQLIKVPTGCQDYYPALYGGVNAIHLEADGIHREAIPVPPEEIESRFVLAYTGAPRQSGINNWEVFQAHINGDRRVLR